MGVQKDENLALGLGCTAVLAADEARPLRVADEPDHAPPTRPGLHPLLQLLRCNRWTICSRQGKKCGPLHIEKRIQRKWEAFGGWFKLWSYSIREHPQEVGIFVVLHIGELLQASKWSLTKKTSFKGTVSRDFLLLVFFVNQCQRH